MVMRALVNNRTCVGAHSYPMYAINYLPPPPIGIIYTNVLKEMMCSGVLAFAYSIFTCNNV